MPKKDKSWFSISAKHNSTSADVDIYDEIGYWGVTAKDFLDSIKALGNNIKNITARINSPGGSVTDGIAIYNILKNHPANVHVNIEGVALSMGSVIAMAGDTIEMADNALMMIHNPWGFAMGDSEEMRKTADVMDKMKSGLMLAYSKRVDIEDSELSAMMDAETWFTAEEALDAGFVDSVTQGMDVAARFDLSKFINTPADCVYNSKRTQTIGITTNLTASDNKIISGVLQGLNKQLSEQGIELKSNAPILNESVKDSVADPIAEGDNMPKVVQPGSTDDAVANLDKIREEARAQALQDESARQANIRSTFALHGDQYREVMDACLVDTSVDVSAAQKLLLDEIGKNGQPVSGEPVIEGGTDSRDKYFAAVQQSLDVRYCGAEADHTNEYQGYSLVDHAKYCLQRAGFSMRGLDKMRIVGAAFTHSTSDFPLILENQVNKVLRDAYSVFPETWNIIATTSSVPDFKQNSRYNLGSFNSLDVVPENQEFTHGSFSEEREQIQAQTKGKLIGLSRQMIINDDLGAFLRIATMMGRAAQRSIGNDVYNVLTSNPLMSDGIALFDETTHANDAGTGTAISIASLGEARRSLRMQQDLDANDYLGIMPKYLLTPVAKEDLARQTVTSETDPSQANSRVPNTVRNIAEVVSDPRLDAASATAWYMLADPAIDPTVEVAFLDGNQNPFLETQQGFTIDGVVWKVRLDYGTAAIDFRAGYRNTGA